MEKERNIKDLVGNMTFNDYQEKAVSTAIYGAEYKIIYPALGLANEAGEVLGKIKKVLRDNDGVYTPDKIAGIAGEIGDTMWYMAALARDLNISLDEIAQDNINKLRDRASRGVIQGNGDNR